MWALAKSIPSVLVGAKYWLIAILFVGMAAYGFGYRSASITAQEVLAEKVLEGYNAGVAAQRKFDAAQFNLASKDFEARLKAEKARKDKVTEIIREVEKLVPRVEACTVSPEAMRKLNEVVQ